MSLKEIVALVTADVWVGAILGAVVSAVFSLAFVGAVTAWKWLLLHHPVRRLLGDLVKASEPVGVYVRSMFHHDRQNKYISPRPDYFPPHTTGHFDQWQNIPYVVATSDHEASTDFLNVLGQVDKKDGIEFFSVHDDWSRWDHHVVAIGGHFKAEKLREVCEPRYLTLEDHTGFVVIPTGDKYVAEGTTDYGAIYKGTNPHTKKTCFLLMGLGALGTEAAGHYLRTRGADLGRMVGSEPFLLVVTADLDLGKDSVRVVDLYPRPTWRRKSLHPITWFKRLKPALKGTAQRGAAPVIG